MVAISVVNRGLLKDVLDAKIAEYAALERAWLPHDRRGRWVVLESGAGRYLTDSPRSIRLYVDGLTPRRARRFSSLSQARAFARKVEGTVHHWRRTPSRGHVWKRQTPWERAISMVRNALRLPRLLWIEEKTP